MSGRVLELLRARLATRAISPEPLAPGTPELLAEAARLAPSCSNRQPWRYLFLTSSAGLAKGREVLAAGNRPWAGRAPLLVVGFSRRADDCLMPDGRAYHQLDLGLSVMNLMLAATELGLVARPMAGFDPSLARASFGLAAEDEPLVMLAVGRPSDDESHVPAHYRGIGSKPRERRPVSELVRFL